MSAVVAKSEKLLTPSAVYGVPQTWERVIVAGFRGGYNRPDGPDIRIAPAGDFGCYMGRLKPRTPHPDGSRQRVRA